MSQFRDTIVIGASAGGLRALRDLLAQLPANLPASIFIVQHQAQTMVAGNLAAILGAVTALPTSCVYDSQLIRPGQIYIAPPNKHMILTGDRVTVTEGARENRSRPAINPLFRTAAAERGSRVIGILLTGLLDDGVAGLSAIRRCGGVVVVQDPEDAEYPDMPQYAIDTIGVDHVEPVQQMGALLQQLTQQPAPLVTIPDDVVIEARFSGAVHSQLQALEKIGEQVVAICPDCGGALWRTGKDGALVYRCHTGHAYSARALLDSQADNIEYSLWAAVRALSEKAATLNRLADDTEKRSAPVADGYRSRAHESLVQSEQIRQLILTIGLAGVNEQSDF